MIFQLFGQVQILSSNKLLRLHFDLKFSMVNGKLFSIPFSQF